MFKVLEDYFAAHPGEENDLRAVGRGAGTAGRRRAGAAGDHTIGAGVWTGERGAL
jgi:hypothetical protein